MEASKRQAYSYNYLIGINMQKTSAIAVLAMTMLFLGTVHANISGSISPQNVNVDYNQNISSSLWPNPQAGPICSSGDPQCVQFVDTYSGASSYYVSTAIQNSTGICLVEQAVKTSDTSYSVIAPTTQSIPCLSGSTFSNLYFSPGTYTIEFTVQDAAQTSDQSSPTTTYTINPQFEDAYLSLSSNNIESGQSSSATVSWMGGTPPFTVTLYSSPSSSCSSGSTQVASKSTYDQSYTFSNLAPTSNTYYCATITDSSYSPQTLNANPSEVTVVPPVSVSVSPSSETKIDVGQPITVTATASSGSSPYTYSWSSSCPGFTSPGSASSLIYTPNAVSSCNISVTVTDSMDGHASASTGNIVISNALISGAITPNTPSIDSGQSVTLTANPSGGTSPYSYQWYSGTSSTCSSGTAISGATSSTYTASPSSSTYYCYKVTDSSESPENVVSNTVQVVVYPTPTVTLSLSPSNSIAYGENVIANAIVTGGSGNFIYSWTVNGKPAANVPITSGTENVLVYPATGSYTYKVNVKDVGVSSAYTLVAAGNVLIVSKAVPVLSFPDFPGSYTYDGYQANVTANISTVYSQLAGTLSLSASGVNSVLSNSIYTQNTFKVGPGSSAYTTTYYLTFNTLGDANYTGNSISANFTIYQVPGGVSCNPMCGAPAPTTPPTTVPQPPAPTTTVPQKANNSTQTNSSTTVTTIPSSNNNKGTGSSSTGTKGSQTNSTSITTTIGSTSSSSSTGAKNASAASSGAGANQTNNNGSLSGSKGSSFPTVPAALVAVLLAILAGIVYNSRRSRRNRSGRSRR